MRPIAVILSILPVFLVPACEVFLSMMGVNYADIHGMDKMVEERGAYALQLKFLKRHGDRRDIEC